MSQLPTEPNPYAPPDAPIEGGPLTPTPELAEAEATRRRYLNHEASVKSIGSLQILGGVLTAAGAVLIVAGGMPGGVGQGAFNVLLSVLYVALGVGLTRLRPWARWATAALLGLSLLFLVLGPVVFVTVAGARADQITPILVGYGIGALLVGYMLYLLLSRKAGVVFSRDYQDVIAATPHVKYQNGCLVKGCLAVVAILLLLSVIGGALSFLTRRG